MHDTLSPAESAELARLWRHRRSLPPGDMGTLYRIVGDALRACNPPELGALGEGRLELVAQFLYAKVLQLDGGAPPTGVADDGPPHSAPTTAFALCAYFRRYLIDCTRASAHRRRAVVGEQVSQAQVDASQGAYDDPEAVLRDHGLDGAGVAAAARAFIAALPEPERLLLCEGFGDERPGGLSGVAARHAIASYHYRAGLLGLVHRRSALPADYAATTLGRWIARTLRIPIAAENAEAILRVFEILGAEAHAPNAAAAAQRPPARGVPTTQADQERQRHGAVQ